MFVTLLGIVTFVSSRQRKNAQSPMLVTLDGIVTSVKPFRSTDFKTPSTIVKVGSVQNG